MNIKKHKFSCLQSKTKNLLCVKIAVVDLTTSPHIYPSSSSRIVSINQSNGSPEMENLLTVQRKTRQNTCQSLSCHERLGDNHTHLFVGKTGAYDCTIAE